MAILKKGEKKVQGLPSTLVALTEKAATYTATADFYSDLYKDAKSQIDAYLSADDCPVTVQVGKGGGVKVDGVGGLSFSQPERVDNKAAIDAIVTALKAGTLSPDALTEVISTVSKEGLLKALPDQAESLVVTSEKVVVTLRTAPEFKNDVRERLEKTLAPAVEVPVVQPDLERTLQASISEAVAKAGKDA